MADGLYREKSLERISSPEQLNDYLKVTKPSVWIILVSVILLLAGCLVWGYFAYIGSYVKGTATVSNGVLTMRFIDEPFAQNLKEGMDVTVGDTSSEITYVGYDHQGNIEINANTELNDGTYQATVNYKTTQVLDLLFDR